MCYVRENRNEASMRTGHGRWLGATAEMLLLFSIAFWRSVGYAIRTIPAWVLLPVSLLATTNQISVTRDAMSFRLSVLVFLLAFTPIVQAAPPVSPEDRATFIGAPTEVIISPSRVTLSGPRDVRQLVITGKYSDGTLRDLTPVVDAAPNVSDVVTIEEKLFIRGVKNGTATLTVKAGGKESKVVVTVEKLDELKPVSFRHDVMAAFNVGGCNMGACHGTPSGKNGFKLSLRGFDPTADYLQLTREQFGRRSDKHNPDASLTLLKALGRVPHEGGTRFGASSYPAEMMRQWLVEGMQDDSASLPTVKSLEVTPGNRVLHNPSKFQQLAVRATYSDNNQRDVTRITNFSSSDPGIADVNLNGFVEFKRPGEVAILVRYLEEMVSVRLTYLEPRVGFTWSNPAEFNAIDKNVFEKLKLMTILPSELCTDTEFVRRAYLDAIGRMPTPAEA